MAFKKTFKISDETVNSFGFWVRTQGINLSLAEKNCPAFYQHRTWEVPLGHWENLRIENNELLGDLIIDGTSDEEKNYIRKIENGDLKACSLGADPLVWKNEVPYMKDGSPCLYDSELLEVSILPLPSNSGALALKHKGAMVELSSFGTNDIVPQIQKEPDMKAIALKLGLPETATEAEILAEIGRVQLSKTNADVLNKTILDNASKDLAADQKEIFVTLSKTSPEQALKYAEMVKPTPLATLEDTTTPVVKLTKDVKVSDLIQRQGNKVEKEVSYDELRKTNPVELSRIQKEEPEKYKELVKGYSNGVRYKG